MLIYLKKDECHCDLYNFYRRLAEEMGIDCVANLMFDCRKINVSDLVMEELIDFYRYNRQYSVDDIARILVCSGPKATLNGDLLYPYRAEIDDGFFVEFEEDEP